MKKYCRYGKKIDKSKCVNCEKGCLRKRPVACINYEFEKTIKDMIKNDEQ